MTVGSAPVPLRQDRPLAGIGFMSMALVLMCTMDMVGRMLVLDGLSVLQMLAVRSWLILAVLLVLLPRVGGLAMLATGEPRVHLVRVCCGIGAPIFFFLSLRHLPLADATAVFFGSTFIMTALSVPVLKEKVGWHRWGAVVVGFIGVVIVTRPGRGFDPAALYAVAASLCYAGMVVAARWMGPTEPVFRQVFYFNLGLALAPLPALPFVWAPFSEGQVVLLLVMSALSIGGQFFITRAFVVAPIGVVAPFEYTALVWAALLGYLAWGDIPDAWVVTGSLVIIASGFYILHREATVGRPPVPPIRDLP